MSLLSYLFTFITAYILGDLPSSKWILEFRDKRTWNIARNVSKLPFTKCFFKVDRWMKEKVRSVSKWKCKKKRKEIRHCTARTFKHLLKSFWTCFYVLHLLNMLDVYLLYGGGANWVCSQWTFIKSQSILFCTFYFYINCHYCLRISWRSPAFY